MRLRFIETSLLNFVFSKSVVTLWIGGFVYSTFRLMSLVRRTDQRKSMWIPMNVVWNKKSEIQLVQNC